MVDIVEDDNKVNLMVCRVCLATTRPVSSMHALGLAGTYGALAGVALFASGPLPQAACGACVTQLRAAQQLAERSRRANELLMSLLEKSTEITVDEVNQLDRDDLVTPKCESHPKEDGTDAQENSGVLEPMDCAGTTPEAPTVNVTGTLDHSKGKNRALLRQYFKEQKLNLREQKQQLEKGMLSTNYTESPYKCHSCFKGYKEESSFNTHMAKHEQSSGKLECPICHIRMETRRVQRRHAECHDHLYSCKMCVFVTQARGIATMHARWHCGEAVHKCDICTEEVIFNRQAALLTHRRLRHPDAKSCPICGHSCAGDEVLSQHLETQHTGETLPSEGPRCDECDLTFATDDARLNHLNMTHESLD